MGDLELAHSDYRLIRSNYRNGLSGADDTKLECISLSKTFDRQNATLSTSKADNVSAVPVITNRGPMMPVIQIAVSRQRLIASLY